MFRYNNRKGFDDKARFDLAVRQIVGKRLTFDQLTGKEGENAEVLRCDSLAARNHEAHCPNLLSKSERGIRACHYMLFPPLSQIASYRKNS